MGVSATWPLLLLVNPGRQYRYNWDLEELCQAMGKKAATHPLALPLLAALTPAPWEVAILDEELEPFVLKKLRRRPDLVGITGMVSNAKRGYAIADELRRAGIPVIMGGPYVSTNVDEALAHVDAVVIGQAEPVWGQCLADAEAGRLEPRYLSDGAVPYERSPVPRWDLVDTSAFLACGVQVSRGCPHHCEFCLVRKLVGSKQRYRDIDDVMAEIQALPTKQLNFVDDNLTANRRYARELMERLIPLGVTWSCQASLDVAYEPDFVKLMARAGCDSILLGFESLDPAGLAEAGKDHNSIEKYERAIEHVHAAGIHIVGAFVVGFDVDTTATFDRIVEFVQRNRLSHVMVATLSPYPGTDLYTRMEREDRLTPMVTDLANGLYPLCMFANMTQPEMFRGVLSTWERVYSYASLRKRMPSLLARETFRRPSGANISMPTKIRTSLHILASHLLSPDADKRRFFRTMLDLVRRNRADVNTVVPYILMVESVRGFLKAVRSDAERIVAQLERNEAAARRRVGPSGSSAS